MHSIEVQWHCDLIDKNKNPLIIILTGQLSIAELLITVYYL